MKTRIQGLIGLGLALVAASGAAAADKPVFGLVMSFSGWFQPIDADTIAGAKLAVDDINAAGGVLGQPIEIVQFDNKSDPPLGADGAIDVINKGAKAILFPSDFDFGAPGAYVAQQNNVIAFSAASDPKFGVAGVGPLAYSVSNAAQAQGALMAEWAYKTKGWRTGYVLLDNTISYTKSLCGSFATRWKRSGSTRIRRTVWRGLSEVIGSWKIICMRRRSGRIRCSGSCVMSCPSKTMRPASMSMSRMSARPSVVFPEPDSPTMPTVSPRPILRSTPFRTLTPPTRSPFRRRLPP